MVPCLSWVDWTIPNSQALWASKNSNHPIPCTKLSQNLEIDIPQKTKPLQWTQNCPKEWPKTNHGPLACHIQLVRSQDQNQKSNSDPLTCHIQLVRSQGQKQNPKPDPLTCHIQLVRSQGQKSKNPLDRLMRHIKPLGSQGQMGKSKIQKPKT